MYYSTIICIYQSFYFSLCCISEKAHLAAFRNAVEATALLKYLDDAPADFRPDFQVVDRNELTLRTGLRNSPGGIVSEPGQRIERRPDAVALDSELHGIGFVKIHRQERDAPCIHLIGDLKYRKH